MGLWGLFHKNKITGAAKAAADETVRVLLPIYKRLAPQGLSMDPPEFQAVYAAGEKLYNQYGFEALAYGVKELKRLCPASTTRPDETWSQVVDVIRTGSHPYGNNLFM